MSIYSSCVIEFSCYTCANTLSHICPIIILHYTCANITLCYHIWSICLVHTFFFIIITYNLITKFLQEGRKALRALHYVKKANATKMTETLISDFGISPLDIDKFEYAAIVFARMFSQEVRRREDMKRANA